MKSILLIAVMMTAPPPGDKNKDRRQRVTKIHQLAQSNARDDIKAFMSALKSGADWEKHAALLALRPAHKPFVKPILPTLITSKHSSLRIESCVQRYRLWRSRDNARCLETLRPLGSNLRRAFQVGEKRGRPIYDKRGEAFFLGSIRHSNLYTRLDGALGLIEHDPKGRGNAGLVVIGQELKSSDENHRLIVIQHLSVEYDDPGLRRMLESARRDKSPKVRARAEEIRARQ